METRACLIWSFQHNAWWAPHANGYVQDSSKAGRYSIERGMEICRQANLAVISEALVPVNVPEALRKPDPSGVPHWERIKLLALMAAFMWGHVEGGETDNDLAIQAAQRLLEDVERQYT